MLESGSSQVNWNVAAPQKSVPPRPATIPTARDIANLAADLLRVLPSSRAPIENVKNDGRTLSQAPATLTQLSVVTVCGKVEGLADVDELLRDIRDLDKRCVGVPKLLLHGTTLAVRDEFLNLRIEANGRPVVVRRLGKAQRKAGSKDLRAQRRARRAEIAPRALANWKSCELVAKVLQLTRRERNWLELYAVKHFGIPRVQAGEPCRQVLQDLGISEYGSAKELLLAFAVEGPGVFRVTNGEDWRKVYESLDVDPRKRARFPDHNLDHILRKFALYYQGIPRAIGGEAPAKLHEEFGFSESDSTNFMLGQLNLAAIGQVKAPPPKTDPEQHYRKVTERLLANFIPH